MIISEARINNYLPEHYSPDDKKWIAEKLSKLPEKVRRKVAAQYSEVYLAAYNDEQVTHKKENAAINAANTRLRKYVERYSSVMSCKVCEPPIVTQ